MFALPESFATCSLAILTTNYLNLVFINSFSLYINLALILLRYVYGYVIVLLAHSALEPTKNSLHRQREMCSERISTCAGWAMILSVTIGLVFVSYLDQLFLSNGIMYLLFDICIAGVAVGVIWQAVMPCCNKDTVDTTQTKYLKEKLTVRTSVVSALDVDLTDNTSIGSKQSESPHKIKNNKKQQHKKKPRAYWMDRLKVVLTVIVVIHHATGAMRGSGSATSLCIGNFANSFQWFSLSIVILDQSYFMSLFFFVSAYFTPSSYDKKGPKLFLADKFKRLGIPFLVSTLVLMPLIDYYIAMYGAASAGANVTASTPFWYNASSNPTGFTPPGPKAYSYSPYNPGPTWFLLWLLFFNAGYVFIAHTDIGMCCGRSCKTCCERPCSPCERERPNSTSIDIDEQTSTQNLQMTVSRPSTCVMLSSGALAGVFTWFISFQLNLAIFFMMPITNAPGSLPLDMLFFTAGVLAKRNGWLDDWKPSPCHHIAWCGTTIGMALLLFGWNAMLWKVNSCQINCGWPSGNPYPYNPVNNSIPSETPQILPDYEQQMVMLFFFLLLGHCLLCFFFYGAELFVYRFFLSKIFFMGFGVSWFPFTQLYCSGKGVMVLLTRCGSF